MDSAWSSFTPEVTKERVGMSYRFKFPGSGLFHCSFTGLVFNVTHEGEVTYKCLIWDDMLLQPANKVPGGPLFRIKCPQESISKLYLPHCEPEPALVAESLSVVHITDDGMSIIQPLEITETHVVVDIPHLSTFGIVWDIIKRFKNFLTKPINGRILVFLRPRFRGIVIINFILLASNVPVNEVKAQHDDSEFIEAPSFCLLHKFQNYSLHSDPGDYHIQPERALFFGGYGPNYHATFEIILTKSIKEMTVMIQDQGQIEVWKHVLHLAGPPSPDEKQPRIESNTSAEEKLLQARPDFIDQVSNPVLNKLLDELLERGVLTDAEREAARAKPRAEKAGDLIDMVRNKGVEASSHMITILSTSDPFLSEELNLK
ncbi:caspase recruitment domain-containing protein 8-like [Lates japonicus]|uniref:Caspase recruitment domain-containing protein 8-like protein n=1 Tax=Lates japonicus TaxID=270547 RepID=A0AAD3MXR9_LATJO|nr:caspase recruitment domain-containing protein 8-like protein [Lates japonicus]